jgi:hypothetical protein
VLAKVGVSKEDALRAVQVMKDQPSHEIPNVALSKAFLRALGL